MLGFGWSNGVLGRPEALSWTVGEIISGIPGPPAFSTFLYGLLAFGIKTGFDCDPIPNCACPICSTGAQGPIGMFSDMAVLEGLRAPGVDGPARDGGPEGVKPREGGAAD